MLDGLRTASQTWFGKAIMTVVFGVIILSFAIWGIGDMFRGFGTGRLASVGKTEISAQSFRFHYQNELQRLQRRLGRVVTNEQARQAGLDRQVLGRLMTEAALDQKAQALGLAMSDAALAKTITDDPSFKGADGKFSKDRFDGLLRENGYTERYFTQEQRAVYLRQELAEGLIGKVTAPALMVEALDRYRTETRSVEYFLLPLSAVIVPEPDAAALEKFFEERKTQFAAPEYRTVAVLTLTPATAAKPADVSDADARARYEAGKARFGTPEKRRVTQIVYPTEAEAQAAADQMKAGAAFETLMAARALAAADVDLGLLSKQDIAEPALADAVFALSPGVVSGPVKTKFGYAVARVDAIEPETVKPFAELADQMRKEIATERASKTVRDAHDTIEDQRSAGKPLAEAARAAGLDTTIVEVDAQGRGKTGAPVAGVAGEVDYLRAIFASDVGVDNEALTTRDNGYKWFEIAGVEPARQKTLEDSRAAVTAAWRTEEAQRALTEKSADLVKRLRDGATLASLAAQDKAEIVHAPDVKRVGAAGLSEAAVVQIFDQPSGGAGSAPATGGRIVFHVLDSVTQEFNPEKDAAKNLAEQLQPQIGDDILGEYVRKLEQEYGVQINDAAFRAATGGGDQ